MRLYLVRHGETDWNKARKLQGRADIELNEFGRLLAKKTGEGLNDIDFYMAYSSPLKRAKETAEIIIQGTNTPLKIEERIIELGFGLYEGACGSEKMGEVLPEIKKFFYEPDQYQPPADGESLAALKKRVTEFLVELLKKKELKDKNILVVTHGTALRGMLNYVNKKEIADLWRGGVHGNCAVTILESNDHGYKMIEEGKVFYDKELLKSW